MPRTNPANWRLKVEHGRQTWHYLKAKKDVDAWPQTAADKYWLGILRDETPRPSGTAPSAAKSGLLFYKQLQTTDGHFAGLECLI